MTATERTNYLEATAVERRHKAEIDRLYDRERQSRWQGEALTGDDIRRLGSMQQTLTEMGRGERFVMDYLRTRGRERERWYVGLPLTALYPATAPVYRSACSRRCIGYAAVNKSQPHPVFGKQSSCVPLRTCVPRVRVVGSSYVRHWPAADR